MTEPVLSMRDVSVAYQGDITILNEVSLDFMAARITGIIGPNGAGKSTVLKTLYGFLKLRGGSIRFHAEDIGGLRPHELVNRGISYVPQHRSVFEDLSVEENLRLGCWPFRKDKARVSQALERGYDHFPILGDKRRDRAGGLSGGQQRFIELARALIVDPQVILMDEPTAMIAPKLSKEIYAFIRTLPEQGISVILVDQNVRQCAAVSDYLYVLELGRNKAGADRSEFAEEGQLRSMIAEWLAYEID